MAKRLAIKKLNTTQYKKLIRLWKNILGDKTKHTEDPQNNIQGWNNILKSGYLSRNNVWTYFRGTLWESINHLLLVTPLSNSEASRMKVYLYRETVSLIGAVKYTPLGFLTRPFKASRTGIARDWT